MLKTLLIKIVDLSARRPRFVLAAAMITAIASCLVVEDRFAINTDINKLISTQLPWRQREVALAKAFPSQETSILAVIDAPTPELAQSAARKLTEALQKETDTITGAQQVFGGAFFDRNGLLFLSKEQLQETLTELARSAPLLSGLANDPNLRGILGAISLSARGVQARRVPIEELSDEFNSFSTALENLEAGRPAFFSWRDLLGDDGASSQKQTRQFVEVFPVLDYNSLEPGEEAADAIRETAFNLHLEPEGVTVRLTGPVQISDEEFGTLKQGAATNGVITILAVLLILWLALHSARIIAAVFVSLFVGLAATAALGLLMVGAFNPISVAFFVLFVGIGVDFGLQFSVSYRAERFENQNLHQALVSTARNTGGRLALAAMATAAGFMAFTPTAYAGLSELGEIAGAGMLIAFFTSITVLPAMLRLINPPAEPHPLGYAFLRPVDEFLERNRITVLVVTLCAVLAGLPLLYWLRFDFNPMNLRSPKVESVATYLDLRKDPEMSGRTIEILMPTLAEANDLAKKLSGLPEVARALTLDTLVPSDQDEKIAMIQKTASDLSSVMQPAEVQPAPTDAENVSQIEATSGLLKTIADRAPGTLGGQAAARLAAALSNLAKASPEMRKRAEEMLVPPLKITLDDIRQSLSPQKVTLEKMPKELISEWVAKDGQARVSVTPRGDSDNNDVLRQFVEAVTRIAPNASGEAVGIQKAGETIVNAFIEAAVWALVSIAVLLWLAFRRISDVALTLFPLLLAGTVTLELCVILDMPLNFANIIALPVLLGIGVAFKIYYIMAWREGGSGLLASPLTRAVFFSGMTTAVAFGSLWLSNHPGTSSMGKLLALSLVSTMAAAVLFQPLLMGPPRAKPEDAEPEKNAEPAYLEMREHTS
jgi:hopanoid biosynthesis associated RND transporter like protein HpnN